MTGMMRIIMEVRRMRTRRARLPGSFGCGEAGRGSTAVASTALPTGTERYPVPPLYRTSISVSGASLVHPRSAAEGARPDAGLLSSGVLGF